MGLRAPQFQHRGTPVDATGPLKTLGLIADQPAVATCDTGNASLITANPASYRCSATRNSLV
ncbi:hypothetical protein [Mycobacterium sp. 1423905.2]|uniref:hypothetical protein n=1 Tax=Mycobacterium sp. 1423905.2 TaxID=1856859 RepID=UPI0007FC2E28|nr:hypothetical protein [Mycobacterium sp. 1423905.2]OBJ55298.1 hypothetical protein A9W95_15305 [Mycobacterium sp. 1423905.2]